MYIAVTGKSHLVTTSRHGDALRAYRACKNTVKGVYSIVNDKAEHCNISASGFHSYKKGEPATELMVLDRQANIALKEYLDSKHVKVYTIKDIAERAEVLKEAHTLEEIINGNSLDMHMEAMRQAEIQLIAEGQYEKV